MKKIVFSLVLSLSMLSLVSCGNKAKEEAPKVDEAQVALIAKGQALFTEKTCVACHNADAKLVGPSLQSIVDSYKAKSVDIKTFLKGETKSILDSTLVDSSMVTIMAANVVNITSPMADEDLDALIAYINSIVK